VGGLPSGTADYSAGVLLSPTTPTWSWKSRICFVLRKTIRGERRAVDRLDPGGDHDLGLVAHYTF
jgi:hypothetical protein